VIQIPQVQIQVWISQTDENGARDIGANLNWTRYVRGVEQSGSVERVRTQTFTPSANTFDATMPAPDGNPYSDNVRLAPESRTNWTTGNALSADSSRPGEYNINTRRGAGLSFNIIDSDRGTLEGIFRAIEKTTDSDLISKPELLVNNAQNAMIKAGEEIPFQGVSLTPVTNVPILNIDWRQIGVNIDIKPTILSPELIQIDIVQLEVVDRLKATPIQGLQVPVFSTRSQNGSVLVPNTQTLVIGGLSSRVVRKAERRVPVIGVLPVIGIPFRGRSNEAYNSQLLIFISPTIVNLREDKQPMASALNFWKEVEWTNRERIQQEIDLMEEEL
jgi:general secretion pathway protein D